MKAAFYNSDHTTRKKSYYASEVAGAINILNVLLYVHESGNRQTSGRGVFQWKCQKYQTETDAARTGDLVPVLLER